MNLAITSLHPAYILHYRKYRDTSLILDLFSRDFGKYSAVARGAQGPRSRMKGMLQPFVPILLACFGRGELKTVRSVDFTQNPIALTGDRLLVGLYVNELLNRLTGRYDPMEGLYGQYEALLFSLERGEDVETLLRRFEIVLLNELGYGISFDMETVSGRAIEPEHSYLYQPEAGFTRVVEGGSIDGAFRGTDLLAIGRDDLARPEVKAAAKRITRLAIHPLLEGKPLNSRALFAGRPPGGSDAGPLQ